MFVKYGRRGEPHPRFVYISAKEEYLVWCIKDFSEKNNETRRSNTFTEKEKNEVAKHRHGSTTIGKETNTRRIALKDIIDVKVGYNATEVLKRHSLPKELDSLCLSIVTPTRTLDLKANDF